MHATAGEPVQQPRVDGAEREVGGALRRRPRAAATPASSRRSTGRARARCARRISGSRPGVAPRVAVGRGAAVLPDDRPVQRPTGAPAPHDDGLALVGDPDARDGLARGFGRARDLRRASRWSRPRSRRRRARPSPAAGSAAGTRGARCAGRWPRSSIASVRMPVVPASMLRTTAIRRRAPGPRRRADGSASSPVGHRAPRRSGRRGAGRAAGTRARACGPTSVAMRSCSIGEKRAHALERDVGERRVEHEVRVVGRRAPRAGGPRSGAGGR